jgi:hypothetical protein
MILNDMRLPIYNSILKILTNPVYAGAYAFGKTQARTTVVDVKFRVAIARPVNQQYDFVALFVHICAEWWIRLL